VFPEPGRKDPQVEAASPAGERRRAAAGSGVLGSAAFAVQQEDAGPCEDARRSIAVRLSSSQVVGLDRPAQPSGDPLMHRRPLPRRLSLFRVTPDRVTFSGVCAGQCRRHPSPEAQVEKAHWFTNCCRACICRPAADRHRLDRLAPAVQHQTPQITRTPEPFHLPQPHTVKMPPTSRDHPT
jgi:hypothetical protein